MPVWRFRLLLESYVWSPDIIRHCHHDARGLLVDIGSLNPDEMPEHIAGYPVWIKLQVEVRDNTIEGTELIAALECRNTDEAIRAKLRFGYRDGTF